MATISAALTIAVEHHQAGRLPMAEEIYRRILAVEPNHPDALHLLGLVEHQTGRQEQAIEHIGRAIEAHGTEATFYSSLADAYLALQRIPDAVACYRRALALQPDFAEVHSNLGNVLKAQGELDEAITCYQQALQFRPDLAGIHGNLGNAFQLQGKLDAAVACYRRALEIQPDLAEVHNNLGNVVKDQGKLDEAIAGYRRAVQLKPDYAEAHNNLGSALKDQGRLDEAVVCYKRALQLKPDHVRACYSLGVVFQTRGKADEAIACYRRALEIKPDYAEAHNNAGSILKDQGKLDEAMVCYRRALEVKPDYAEAHNNLGNVLKAQGRVDEAIASYRRAIQLKPDFAAAHSNLLCVLQYRHGVTLAELAEAHQEFERRHAAPLQSAWRAHDNVRAADRRLRVGFVSPDFRHHPVAYFLISVFESLDRRQCETICYNDETRPDDMTARFRAAASAWRDTHDLADDRLAEQIRADRIDILFDLAGHTANNRLLVFARKPAPIQITWIGYESTTGLAAMDYLLADQHMAPESSQRHYRERILRMPDVYLCYEPPSDAPPVGQLPAARAGYVTFGSFNNAAKVGPHVVEVWAAILRRVAHSRLVMKRRGLGDESVRRRYLELFAGHGVDPARLCLLPAVPYLEHLAAYQQLDLALDPFPYSGTTTSCEALWMGVPSVTYPGETFASRDSLTQLYSVGLAEGFVARDAEHYVELAAQWANNLDRLAEVRAALRGRMTASPLCDSKRFAANLLSLLRDVWRNWVSGA